MRAAALLPLLLAGCIHVRMYDPREVSFHLRDAEGAALPEWWVLSWQERDQCDFGCVWVLHGTNMTPRRESIAHVQLLRMTPAQNRMTWPGAFDAYLWYLLVLPPGGAWQGWTWFTVVAPGQIGRWDYVKGREYPWEIHQDPVDAAWRVDARNRPSEPGSHHHTSAFWDAHRVVGLLDEVDLPRILPREDLRRFLETVLSNLEEGERRFQRSEPYLTSKLEAMLRELR